MSAGAPEVPGLGWRMPLLVGVLVLVLIGCAGGFLVSSVLHERALERRNLRLSLLGEQDRIALTIFRQAPRAMSGIEPAFAAVRHARAAADPALRALRAAYDGDAEGARPGEPAGASGVLVALDKEWTALNGALDLLLAAEEPILGLRESLEALNAHAAELEVRASRLLEGAPGWQFEPAQRHAVANLRLLSARLGANFRRSLDPSGVLIDSEQYGRDAKLLAAMGDVITGLLLGDPSLGIPRVGVPDARRILDGLGEIYREASATLRAIMSNTLVVIHVRETGETIAASAERIPAVGAELRERESRPVQAAGLAAALGAGLDAMRGRDGAQAYAALADAGVRNALAAATAGVLAVIVLAMLAGARSRIRAERSRAVAIRQRQEAAAEEERRSHRALVRLRDEIGGLADGDLRVRASATGDDVAGAVAEAVNHAVDALCETVASVEQSAIALESVADRARLRALALDDAGRAQVERTAHAGVLLSHLASAAEGMVDAGSGSRAHAAQLREIAHRGGGRVGEGQAGIEAAAHLVQEGAERLARLRERAGEAERLIDLVDAIAEETHVLAINAAIRASAAGEAWSGFAALADDMQALAERAGEVAKGIASLLADMGVDARDAVAALRGAQTQAVAGTRAVGEARDLLTEIEAELEVIEGRSGRYAALRAEHAVGVEDLERVMDGVREAVGRLQPESADAARTGEALAELAGALRGSVSRLALPEPDAVAALRRPAQQAVMRAAARVAGREVDGGAVGEAEMAPADGSGGAAVAPKVGSGEVEVMPRQASGAGEVTPQEAPDQMEVMPQEALGAGEMTREEARGAGEMTAREATGEVKVTPKESSGEAEVTLKEPSGEAAVTPHEAPGEAKAPSEEAPGNGSRRAEGGA